MGRKRWCWRKVSMFSARGVTRCNIPFYNRVQPCKGILHLADMAAVLLNRLLRKELCIEGFLHLSNQLPDDELEALLVLLRQRSAEQRKLKSSGRKQSLPETNTTVTAMRMTLKSRHNFLEATALGQVSLPDAIQQCKTMCDLAAGLGLRKILFDCLALEGELSVEERFELGKTIAEYCQLRMRVPTVALVGQPPAVTGLGARIASNRGLPVRTFVDRQTAEEWLMCQP